MNQDKDVFAINFSLIRSNLSIAARHLYILACKCMIATNQDKELLLEWFVSYLFEVVNCHYFSVSVLVDFIDIIAMLWIPTKDCCRKGWSSRNCSGNGCLSYSFEFIPFWTSSLDNLGCKWTSIPMVFYIQIRTRYCACNRSLSDLFECVGCGLSSLHLLACKCISSPLIWYFLMR